MSGQPILFTLRKSSLLNDIDKKNWFLNMSTPFPRTETWGHLNKNVHNSQKIDSGINTFTFIHCMAPICVCWEWSGKTPSRYFKISEQYLSANIYYGRRVRLRGWCCGKAKYKWKSKLTKCRRNRNRNKNKYGVNERVVALDLSPYAWAKGGLCYHTALI